MKRSIISLIVLALFTLTGATADLIYSSVISKRILQVEKQCKSTNDFEAQYKLLDKLYDEFTQKESINELFFSRKLIENIEKMISDSKTHAKHKNAEGVEMTLSKLSADAKRIKCGGIF